MTTIRNPKQEGSRLFDCKPQVGLCPMNCNQCFYNRPGAFYVDPELPHMPDPSELGPLDVMRVNSGHDSNIEREKVIAETACYPNRFFNTAIPKFDFPGPVVFTANREEEKPATLPHEISMPENLMYVRLRTSATNLSHVGDALRAWTSNFIPVVLTFMSYYDGEPPNRTDYEWKKRHINEYWCPTREFRAKVLRAAKLYGGRLVGLCGTLDSNWCRDCGKCEHWYWLTRRHMEEIAR